MPLIRYFSYLDELSNRIKGLESSPEPSKKKCLYKDFPAVEDLVNKITQSSPANTFAGRTKAAILLENGSSDAAAKVGPVDQVLSLLAQTDGTRRYYYTWLAQLIRSG